MLSKKFLSKNVLSDVPNAINSEFLKLSENEVLRVLLFGDKSFIKEVLLHPQFV